MQFKTESSNEGFLISYNSDYLTIKVSSDFTTGETYLVINNTVYNETDPFEIRDRIIPIINETFVNWDYYQKKLYYSDLSNELSIWMAYCIFCLA
ncbi:hypothetical protein BK720_06810 [Bacillus thuringiensis serovar brasilensis]|uniref:hypothetical protein n=1 Tax=Bacillus cereus group TaxID=86661 RepID=UPI000A3B6A77|nr:hypothetical protein [Bacillus thuringiensis]MCU5032214.1 hypothetical protein [Bacillus cereus]MRA75308.1 hypothetical protein [Bacillus thuringiensis]MRA93797.1 hypothetical protein [Bacillus thuringiensis]MRC56519.1 hypothetical protein [Bacillus thuringiensis]OTX35837.1 hypothetical protein BK720_06810 [Bacillus thuringiensis serovar brasilensis]